MKSLMSLAVALVVGLAAVGCGHKATTEKKTEITTTGPDGQRKTTVDEKVEIGPGSTTRTTTERVENKPSKP
jgi:ABC-type glycerol-3-phosphate transport system substrate-binding protein